MWAKKSNLLWTKVCVMCELQLWAILILLIIFSIKHLVYKRSKIVKEKIHLTFPEPTHDVSKFLVLSN